MGGYSPFSGGLSDSNDNRTYPILAVKLANIEDRADQRRLSNAALDHLEQITESINRMTDISDKEDAESVRFHSSTVMKQLFMDYLPRTYYESFFNL